MRNASRPTRSRWAALTMGGLLALAVAAPALAHAELVSSEPAADVVLAGTPDSVTVTFSEPLDAGKSSFSLVGPAGAVGRGAVDPSDTTRLILATSGLVPGEYEIQWTAAGLDGHLERGRIPFSIAAPTPAPPTPLPTTTPVPSSTPSPSATAPATVEPAPSPSPTVAAVDDARVAAEGGDVLLPIVAGLVLVAGLGAYVARRSRRA